MIETEALNEAIRNVAEIVYDWGKKDSKPHHTRDQNYKASAKVFGIDLMAKEWSKCNDMAELWTAIDAEIDSRCESPETVKQLCRERFMR